MPLLVLPPPPAYDRLRWTGPSPVAAEDPPLAWIAGGRRPEDLPASLAEADARRVACVAVDARPAEAGAFERAGFRPEGRLLPWEAERAPPLPRGRYGLHPVTPAEALDVAAFDAARYGASRGALVARLLGASPPRAFVAFDRATGAAAGWGAADGAAIGPVVADDPDAATLLLVGLLGAGAPPRLLAWDANPTAAGALAAAGFARSPGEERLRLARGALPMRAGTLFAERPETE